MQTAIAWISAHWAAIVAAVSLLGTYHVGSAFIDTLPMPNTNSTQFYRWAFNFTNRLAANYSRAKASNGPAGMQPPKP
jgi:hypothetical protein